MNTKILILIGALAATNSYAILISPVSALRTLSISGTAETESYSQTQSSSGLGVFNQSLSGAAETINAIAQSLASQTSSILENGFSIDTLLNGTTAEPLFGPNFGNYFEPPGGLAANASSTFEFTFQILEPVSYELGGSFSRFGHDFPGPTFAFSLLSPLGTTILGGNYIGRDITYTGTLLSDTYTFRLLADIHAQKDPLGDQQFIQSSAIFRVAAVPEAGSTLLLLAGGFGMLHFFARKFVQPRGRGHGNWFTMGGCRGGKFPSASTALSATMGPLSFTWIVAQPPSVPMSVTSPRTYSKVVPPARACDASRIKARM